MKRVTTTVSSSTTADLDPGVGARDQVGLERCETKRLVEVGRLLGVRLVLGGFDVLAGLAHVATRRGSTKAAGGHQLRRNQQVAGGGRRVRFEVFFLKCQNEIDAPHILIYGQPSVIECPPTTRPDGQMGHVRNAGVRRGGADGAGEDDGGEKGVSARVRSRWVSVAPSAGHGLGSHR